MTLSGSDKYGRPSVAMLPHILDWLHADLSDEEEYGLFERIKLIHAMVTSIRISKIPNS